MKVDFTFPDGGAAPSPRLLSFPAADLHSTRVYRVLMASFWVLPSFTEFYRVLRSFTEFYWVLLGFTGFYLVLLGFTGFYWVLLGFGE